MSDGRVNNGGTIGNKGGWTGINRERWTDLKNETIRLAFEALTGDDKAFKQKVILKMLDKINIDSSDIGGKTFIIREASLEEIDQTDDNALSAEQVAKDSTERQELVLSISSW